MGVLASLRFSQSLLARECDWDPGACSRQHAVVAEATIGTERCDDQGHCRRQMGVEAAACDHRVTVTTGCLRVLCPLPLGSIIAEEALRSLAVRDSETGARRWPSSLCTADIDCRVLSTRYLAKVAEQSQGQ